MTILRPFLLACFVSAAFAGHALIGSAQQAAPASDAAAANPLDQLYFRPIGPASMSGRIADLAVYEAEPSTYYVGTAHGGVWKTTNNGTTFEAQLQDQGLMSVGDVTISQTNRDLVWVGTGESSNRQSTSWGDGVYKSTDGGKTYTNMGLRTSRHINRIVIDPRDNNTVFVAATGSLWGPGGERGVFKTTDGGKTWKQVLEVDVQTTPGFRVGVPRRLFTLRPIGSSTTYPGFDVSPDGQRFLIIEPDEAAAATSLVVVLDFVPER